MSASTQQQTNGQTQRTPRKARTKTQIAASEKKAKETRAANKLAAQQGQTQAAISTIKPTAARALAMTARAAAETAAPPVLMSGLVQTLPVAGTAFPKEQRAAFLAAATSILDLLYPLAPIAKAA